MSIAQRKLALASFHVYFMATLKPLKADGVSVLKAPRVNRVLQGNTSKIVSDSMNLRASPSVLFIVDLTNLIL